MGCRFSNRDIAIVATRAVPIDAGVIEHCTRETVCVMAIVTGVAALDVTGAFSSSDAVIVATGAAADNRGVINSADRRKIGRVMTVLTVLCSSNMLHRFAHGRYNPTWGMACRAIIGSALENPAYVATVAGQELVLTSEQKPAPGMIKAGDLTKAHPAIA